MKFALIPSFLFTFFIFNLTLAQTTRIEQSHIIFSDHLNESRILEISLPLNYELSNKDYPVLYLLDGEYIFGYAKGLIDFHSNPFGYLPDMIIVSIPNTDRNRDLYVSLNPQDGYTDFIDFLEQELIPFVNKNYRANGFDILYGWSSGASICTYLLANQPELFDAYIEGGSGIGSKTADMLAKQIPLHDYTGKYLYANTEGMKYLNTPGQGLRVGSLEKYSNLIDALHPKGLKWKIEVAENASHVGVLAKGLQDGLQFIFSDYFIPDSISTQGASQIIAYYENIKKHYAGEMDIPLGALNESAFILWQENKIDEALELLKHGIEIHPESPDLFGTLGEIYEYKGEEERAAKSYKLAFKKAIFDLKVHLKYKTLYQKIIAKR